MKTVMWNYDKPHRCPECHSSAWVYDGEGWQAFQPVWWKTYQCPCGARFTGRWAWFPKMRDLYLHRIINWILRRL